MEMHTIKVHDSKETEAEKDFPSEDQTATKNNTNETEEPFLRLGEDIDTRSGHLHDTGFSRKTGYIETFMHHFKGNVGVGIFSLGDAFKNGGLILSLPLSIILGYICVHAQHVLIKCNKEVMQRIKKPADEQQDYAITIELCFATGPVIFRKYAAFMRKLVNACICVTQLGFCCVSFIFFSTNVKQVLGVWGIDIDGHVLLAIALVPILLINTSIRNLKLLVPVSSLANSLMLFGYLATIYLISFNLPPISDRPYAADWSRLPLFFGTIVYSFEGIAFVLPLRSAMKKPKDFERPLGVLNIGMVIICAMFLVLGFMSYLKYGDDVLGSVTLNLEPIENILPQSIKLAISLSTFSNYALQFYVPIVIMWPALQDKFGPFQRPVMMEIIFRTLLCLVTFILSEFIPKLGLFISLIGALCSNALALLFPSIAETLLCMDNPSTHKFTIGKNIFILIIGFLGCFTGTYESIRQIVMAFSDGL